MNELTQRGIAALKAGDRATAQQILQAAVKQTPDDVVAWLWLSGAVESDRERVTILRHILSIDPGNQAAERGLRQVLARNPQAGAPAPDSALPDESHSGAPTTSGEYPDNVRANADQEPVGAQETAIPLAENPQTDPATQAAAILAAKRRKKEVDDSIEQVIFRTRPSLVQALVTFWLFFLGALGIGWIMSEIPGFSTETVFITTMAVFLLFELIVAYVVIRRYRMRYVLTNQHLTLPFRGRAEKIPVAEILGVECQQSFMQKILSIGDVDVHAVTAGELARLRMHDVPDCQKRSAQIQNFVQDTHL